MAKRKGNRRRRRAKPKPSLCEGVAWIGAPAKVVYDAHKAGQDIPRMLAYRMTGYDPASGNWKSERADMGKVSLGFQSLAIVGRKMKLNKYMPKWLPFKVF